MPFATHSLEVVAHLSDRLLDLQRGMVVKEGSTDQMMQAQRQAYTRPLKGFGRPAVTLRLVKTR